MSEKSLKKILQLCVNKVKQIESNLSKYLPLSGGEMTGSLSMPHNTAIIGRTTSGGKVNMLYNYNDSVYVGTGSNAATSTYLGCTNDHIILTASNVSSLYDAIFYPANDGLIALGRSANRWYRVYATNSTIQTSDRRKKKDICPIGGNDAKITRTSMLTSPSAPSARDQDDNIYLKLFDNLKPMQYRLVNGDEKLCFGFIAQDIIEVMKEIGIPEDALDIVHHDQFENGEESYGIAYENIIPLLVCKVQELNNTLNTIVKGGGNF